MQAKETYYAGKRDLVCRQKRPSMQAKETCRQKRLSMQAKET
jgi:hypothetical protein